MLKAGAYLCLCQFEELQSLRRSSCHRACTEDLLSTEALWCLQYGWLYLCHFLDLGLSHAVDTILGQMAVVAFTAVGHKKRFRLLTRHVLPHGTPPAHTNMCKHASATIIADAHCWQIV